MSEIGCRPPSRAAAFFDKIAGNPSFGDPSMRYEPCLHIVLYEPEIPPNAGNIGRTCVGIGAKMWLVEPLGFTINDYHLRRAGLDYWDELEWEVVPNWEALVAGVTAAGGNLGWFFSAHASRSYTDVRYTPGDVLVFGSESSGLPASIKANHADQLLTIPSRPQIRSLNLSNTAAVVAFEAVRQWGGLPTEHPAS
jgi:tRNA (cytidine/uridine-2'-O-)-methyltransferase